MAEFKFNITEHIATLSDSGAWTLELNKVAWGNSAPKYDLRKWNEDHSRMSKGISLTESEYIALGDFFREIED